MSPLSVSSSLSLSLTVSLLLSQMDNMEFWLLTAKLQEFYGGASLEGVREEKGLELYCPDLDQACVALSDDKTWYRATVIGQNPAGLDLFYCFRL